MRFPSKLKAFGVGIVASSLATASAAATYVYTGAYFTTAASPFTNQQRVTGSVTFVDTLQDPTSQNEKSSQITSFEFSDGIETVRSKTSPKGGEWFVSFDGNGAINHYLIQIPFPRGFAFLRNDLPASDFVQYVPPGQISVEASSDRAGSFSKISPPSVPEPSTWAMMLLGFGGIGLAMRGRQQSALLQVS